MHKRSGGRPALSWIARAIRAVLIALFVVSANDAVPLALETLNEPPRCGDSCPRCLCRRHSVPAGMRAPCPCCSSRPAGQTGISPLPPAVLPDATRTDVPMPAADPGSDLVDRRLSFAPSVPHPPPRALLSLS